MSKGSPSRRHRLLIDTNTLLDAVIPERPQSQEACRVLAECNGGGDIGLACSLSLRDVYYVLERFYDREAARKLVASLMDLVVIAPVGAEECEMSMRGNEPDFEDGLGRAAAELNDIDFIITRDAAAFKRCRIRSLTAGEYLEIVRQDI